MKSRQGIKKRRMFRWPAAARELVAANLNARGRQLRHLVTKLVETTGHPRGACWRFMRRMGIETKCRYRRWPQSDREKLLEILDKKSVAQAAKRMECTKYSIYAMLRRLNLGPSFRRDCFTKQQLANLLHIRIETVTFWIEQGWLEAKVTQIGKVNRTTIQSEGFCQFCKEHSEQVVGNRLHQGRLDFVCGFVFAPDHNQLLEVRKSKKERAALADSSVEEDESEEEPGSEEHSPRKEDSNAEENPSTEQAVALWQSADDRSTASSVV
jgi:hypothetical protein